MQRLKGPFNKAVRDTRCEVGAGAQPTSSVERLDVTGTERGFDTHVAPMLLPRYRHTLATVGGKLYAVGGQKTDGRATASVERYDPTTDTWTEVAPMGRPRFSHAIAEFDGLLCVWHRPFHSHHQSPHLCACWLRVRPFAALLTACRAVRVLPLSLPQTSSAASPRASG